MYIIMRKWIPDIYITYFIEGHIYNLHLATKEKYKILHIYYIIISKCMVGCLFIQYAYTCT